MAGVRALAPKCSMTDDGSPAEWTIGWLESTSGIWALEEDKFPQFIQVRDEDKPRPMEEDDKRRILNAFREASLEASIKYAAKYKNNL